MMPSPSATLVDPAPRDRARVIFVHPPYVLSESAHPVVTVRVVDDNGRLLGDSLPSSWFSADFPPGHHAFYGWQIAMDGRSERSTGCSCDGRNCAGIAAMTAELLPGRTYYVTVGVTDWRRKVQAYGPHAEFTAEWGSQDRVDFSRVSPDLTTWPRLLRSSLRPFAPNDTTVRTLTSGEGASYRSFACRGDTRIRSGEDWDPTVSALLPNDGAPSP
jgi:hypothetical protein